MSDPRSVLQQAGLVAKKSWGQNFLQDEQVLRDVAQAAASPMTLELGAGLGALTAHLLEHCQHVVAVERDRDLVPLLRQRFPDDPRLTILEANAVTLDYAALAAQYAQPLVVAGNLPYQLSGRILGHIADAATHVTRAVLMIQQEVAERLIASPGGRTFGLLSVLVQRAFAVRILLDVPPESFYPRPKVHSSVVVLEQLPKAAAPYVVAAAKAAFSARRKTLRNALLSALHAPRETIDQALTQTGIDPTRRAETLSIAEFAGLGAALHAAGLL